MIGNAFVKREVIYPMEGKITIKRRDYMETWGCDWAMCEVESVIADICIDFSGCVVVNTLSLVVYLCYCGHQNIVTSSVFMSLSNPTSHQQDAHMDDHMWDKDECFDQSWS